MKTAKRLSGVMVIGALAANVALVTHAKAEVIATLQCEGVATFSDGDRKTIAETYIIDAADGWVITDNWLEKHWGLEKWVRFDRISRVTGAWTQTTSTRLYGLAGTCRKIEANDRKY